MGLSGGMNQGKQQAFNRSLVIRLLRQEGTCSRADLSKRANLNRATITNIIGEFIRCGLVVEDGIRDGGKGRRAIGIRINGRGYRVAGVMVTRRFFCTLLMGLSGEIYEIHQTAIAAGMSTPEIIEAIRREIKRLAGGGEDYRVLAAAVALPGPYKKEAGELVFITNLIGWEGIPVLSTLREGLGFPLFVENDANAGAFAQLWFWENRPLPRNLVYIVAGQGIGCGMVADGSLLYGATGIAGEFGHTTINFDGPQCECGNRGCLEGYCSVLALEKRLREALARGEASSLCPEFAFTDLVRACREGDPLVLREYRKCCEYLAAGIVNLVNQMDPGTVILGDQLTEINPGFLLSIVRHKVSESVRPLIWKGLSIELNCLPYNPVLVGVAALAAERVFEDPFAFVGAST